MASKPKLKNQIKKVNYSGLDLIRLTERQEQFYKMIRNSEISFGTGAAGTAKTFVACYTGLRLLAEGKIKKIILTKPVQESGEKLGFLPGDVDEKIGPYMESFILSIQKMVGEEAAEFLLEHGIIEMRPLAYMRGATFDDCIMILDEAQNCDMRQLMLYITRKGENSKVLIIGDSAQSDVYSRRSALNDFSSMIENVERVGTFKFNREDIVRSKILIEITDLYESWKEENEKD